MEKKTDRTIYVPFVKMAMVKEKEKEVPYEREEIGSPEKVAAFAKKILAGADREYLLVISIDSANKPTAVEIVSVGTINTALAEPREIFKHAILANAHRIIMVHNHTSGRCVPSNEDIRVTKRVEEAGELLGIALQDHIIIGDGYLSFMEEDLLKPCRDCIERIA